MAKNLQIRNVPEGLHRSLKVRAAQAGMTLSEYLLAEMREIAAKPTLEQMAERLRSRGAVRDRESSARIIRRHRDA